MVRFAKTSLEIEKVATGHYLRCDGEILSIRPKISLKDQSYFVSTKVKRKPTTFPKG